MKVRQCRGRGESQPRKKGFLTHLPVNLKIKNVVGDGETPGHHQTMEKK